MKKTSQSILENILNILFSYHCWILCRIIIFNIVFNNEFDNRYSRPSLVRGSSHPYHGLVCDLVSHSWGQENLINSAKFPRSRRLGTLIIPLDKIFLLNSFFRRAAIYWEDLFCLGWNKEILVYYVTFYYY